MKKFGIVAFLLCLFGITYIYRDNIVGFIMKNWIDKDKAYFSEANEYYKNFDYDFVQNTDSLYPNSKQDILNIIYTTLNRGISDINFYCDDGYRSCIADVNEIAENRTYLSTINNLVHPYNSYKNIYFTINDYGKVNIKVSRIYSDSDILLINNKLNDISNKIFYDGMSDYDKILAFHDYIVNNTVYDDTVTIDNQLYIETNSNNATGLLFEGRAICSGYSDVMAIFLNKMGYNNYKISSDDHIWNLIYYDNAWKHIDVTWDDPVTSNGTNTLLHDFFLIDTDELYRRESNLEKNNHSYLKELYTEAN